MPKGVLPLHAGAERRVAEMTEVFPPPRRPGFGSALKIRGGAARCTRVQPRREARASCRNGVGFEEEIAPVGDPAGEGGTGLRKIRMKSKSRKMSKSKRKIKIRTRVHGASVPLFWRSRS
jgi:hypothetical protein